VKILVTGAAGFLGRRVIAALLGQSDPVVTRVVAADLTRCPVDDPRVDPRVGAVEDESFVRSVLERDVDVVYHLAAVLSGQSEAEFDVGMRVNVDHPFEPQLSLIRNAITFAACSGEIWRFRKTNWRSFLATFWRISAGAISRTCARCASCWSSTSKSSGVAQMDSTGVEMASGCPWRSFTVPREAGISSTRP
jgi:hypothetical protein